MRVCVIGLGLIGGSFALALKRHSLAERVYGVDASPRNAEKALSLGLVDELVEFDKAVEVADVIALATPVDTIPQLAIKLLNRVSDKQIVMDMGSTKAELCELISQHPHRNRFVRGRLTSPRFSRRRKRKRTRDSSRSECRRSWTPFVLLAQRTS